MNLRMYFAGGRGFWLAVGGGAVLVLALFFGWARPAHVAGDQARQGLDQVYMELNYFGSIANEIPSRRTLDDRRDFREWLGQQAKIVDQFFAERGALINAPLSGIANPDPPDFKDAYNDALKRQARWFQDNRGWIELAGDSPTRSTVCGFPVYGWVRGAHLPSPDIYPKVRRAYWSRHYLYRRFREANVSSIARLSLEEDLVPLTSKYGGIDFSAELDVAPDRVAGFLDKMLKVSSPAGDPIAVFLIDSFGVEGRKEMADARAVCRVSISGHVLVLR